MASNKDEWILQQCDVKISIYVPKIEFGFESFPVYHLFLSEHFQIKLYLHKNVIEFMIYCQKFKFQ